VVEFINCKRIINYLVGGIPIKKVVKTLLKVLFNNISLYIHDTIAIQSPYFHDSVMCFLTYSHFELIE